MFFLFCQMNMVRISWEIQLFKDIFSASQMHLVFFFLLLKLGVQGKNICRVCELHLTCRTDLHAACYRYFFLVMYDARLASALCFSTCELCVVYTWYSWLFTLICIRIAHNTKWLDFHNTDVWCMMMPVCILDWITDWTNELYLVTLKLTEGIM